MEVFLSSVSYLVLCGSVMRNTLPSVSIIEFSWIAELEYEWDLSTILFWDNESVVTSLSIILFSYGIYIVISSIEEVW